MFGHLASTSGQRVRVSILGPQSTSSACRQINLSSRTEVVKQSVLYAVPRTRTKLGERAFSVASPSAWNALPANIRSNSDTPSFKRQLKTHLFTTAFDV